MRALLTFTLLLFAAPAFAGQGMGPGPGIYRVAAVAAESFETGLGSLTNSSAPPAYAERVYMTTPAAFDGSYALHVVSGVDDEGQEVAGGFNFTATKTGVITIKAYAVSGLLGLGNMRNASEMLTSTTGVWETLSIAVEEGDTVSLVAASGDGNEGYFDYVEGL